MDIPEELKNHILVVTYDGEDKASEELVEIKDSAIEVNGYIYPIETEKAYEIKPLKNNDNMFVMPVVFLRKGNQELIGTKAVRALAVTKECLFITPYSYSAWRKDNGKD